MIEIAVASFVVSEWAVVALVAGLALAFIGLLLVFSDSALLSLPIFALSILLSRGAFPGIRASIDEPRDQLRIAVARAEIQPLKDQLDKTLLPLKELAQQEVLSGEIRGAYVLIGGSVYGQVNEQQELTIVYYDADTLVDEVSGVWRVMVFPLAEARIVTISAGEAPYLKYESETREEPGRIVLFASAVPTLYLPEGWTLIGASEQYGQ